MGSLTDWKSQTTLGELRPERMLTLTPSGCPPIDTTVGERIQYAAFRAS